jgi:hypothetical protein
MVIILGVKSKSIIRGAKTVHITKTENVRELNSHLSNKNGK